MGNKRAIWFAVVLGGALLGCSNGSTSAGPGGAGGTGGVSGAGGSVGSGGAGGIAMNGTGLSMAYPGDVGIASHVSVIFHEDFEDSSLDAMGDGWDSVTRGDTMSFSADVPVAAVAGSQALQMLVPEGNGVTGVTLYESLPTQQGTVYVRYYAKYNDRGDYHHTGMWLGGFNPPTQWPQGTAGITPNGSDFFHNALEPQGDGLELDQYAQWPGMDCWMPTPSCYGNNLMRGARPSVASDEWNCFELMLKLNTPGQSDGEFAVWINDQLVQHLSEGSPNMDRMGGGWWGPDPNGDPFPGFNWRDTENLGFNWIWLDFYVDSGPSSMSWDQVVVATERIGCIAPAQ